MKNAGTRPGKGSLKKCPTCPKGNQWHGIMTFETKEGKMSDRCKVCREKKS